MQFSHLTVSETSRHSDTWDQNVDMPSCTAVNSRRMRRDDKDLEPTKPDSPAHRRLFGDVWKWAGTFRLTEKNIGVDPIQIGVQLRMLLDDARYWADHKTYPPLEAAARFHHRLVQIHCFPNGNGRHARIMTDEYLRRRFDHPPIDWAAGQDLMQENERRDEYIAALRAADAHDYDPLLKFVGDGK